MELMFGINLTAGFSLTRIRIGTMANVGFLISTVYKARFRDLRGRERSEKKEGG